MRLCFGTFVTVLKLCKQDKVENHHLIREIMRTIEPDNDYIGEYGNGKNDKAYRLANCTLDFMPDFVNLARKAMRKEVAQRFEDNVICLLKRDKFAHAVLSLLDIIKKDKAIDREHSESFTKYFGTDKEALIKKQKDFVISEFFASSLLFAVVEIEHSVGKDFLAKINQRYVANQGKKEDGLRIWNLSEEGYVNINTEMRERFVQAINRFGIPQFIYADPVGFISYNSIEKIEMFSKSIEENITRPYIQYRDSGIYRKISTLDQILNDYANYLSLNTQSLSRIIKTDSNSIDEDVDCIMNTEITSTNFFSELKGLMSDYQIDEDIKSNTLAPLHRSENLMWIKAFEEKTYNYRLHIASLADSICNQ